MGSSPAQRMRVRTACSASARDGRLRLILAQVSATAGLVDAASTLASVFMLLSSAAHPQLPAHWMSERPIGSPARPLPAGFGNLLPTLASMAWEPSKRRSKRSGVQHRRPAMGSAQGQPAGPDLAQGIAVEALRDGQMLVGHVGDNAVLLARRGEQFYAIDAACTHYGGPLADGLMVDNTVRCPWHHACFSLT